MTKRSHVTQREADAVVEYAVQLCLALNMPGWKIVVLEEPAEADANASVDWIDQRYVAQIKLGSDWMKVGYDDRREIITHEVMHLLHSKVSTVAIDDSAGYMRDHEHDDWARRVRREFELMVDHLARWLADTHSLVEAWDKAHGRTTQA